MIILFLFALLVPSIAEAACSGSSPTWTAASASDTDINACITAASDGDTINVPAGTVTWSTYIDITKSLTIAGTGVLALQGTAGGTNVTFNGTCVWFKHTKLVRVTGINFKGGCTLRGYTSAPSSGYATASHRFDHNTFHHTSLVSVDTINTDAIGPPWYHPTGLYDHNSFYNYRLVTRGSAALMSESEDQNALWAQDPPLGQVDHVVYAEDNTFDGDSLINWMDGNYGGRYVARFNTISDGYFEVHSVQGPNRAVQMWELYKNTQTVTGNAAFGLAFLRGGTGIAFGNRVPTGTTRFRMNNVRSSEGCVADGSCSTSGVCNGTSTWDQNTGGMSGYACRDQLGSGKDATQWVIDAAYTQTRKPLYFWDNLINNATQYVPDYHEGLAGTSYQTTHIVENRDWYTQNTSFDGTAGVGVGTIASRPATCTTGVGYWSTDEGEWNSLQSGADGQLYRCTSTNTWTLYYTPATYPHPLQNYSAPAASGVRGRGGKGLMR